MTKDSNDPLNRETSVSAELTNTGVKAKTNMRAVAALDRLVGNIAEVWSTKLERSIVKRRALADADVAVIKAAAQAVAERVGADPNLAMRAIELDFEGSIRKQEYKEGVAREAIEQLKLAPPSNDNSGPETVSEEFMANFEPYAERAATDALRAKWGKVLASEIRTPGTFTMKALRITDELSANVARSFEAICKYKLGVSIPRILVPDVPFHERQAMVNAELLVETSLDHVSFFNELPSSDDPILFCNLGLTAISFPKQASQKSQTSADFRRSKDNAKLGMPVYILTEAGEAIASILPNHEFESSKLLAQTLAEKMPGVEIHRYVSTPEGGYLAAGIECVRKSSQDEVGVD